MHVDPIGRTLDVTGRSGCPSPAATSLFKMASSGALYSLLCFLQLIRKHERATSEAFRLRVCTLPAGCAFALIGKVVSASVRHGALFCLARRTRYGFPIRSFQPLTSRVEAKPLPEPHFCLLVGTGARIRHQDDGAI